MICIQVSNSLSLLSLPSLADRQAVATNRIRLLEARSLPTLLRALSALQSRRATPRDRLQIAVRDSEGGVCSECEARTDAALAAVPQLRIAAAAGES